MQKIVGMNGNACGPIKEGSRGLELSTGRGIWGLGGTPGLGMNTFVHHHDINTSTWPNMSDWQVYEATNGTLSYSDCHFDDNEGCKCPAFREVLPPNFQEALKRRQSNRWGISWDGTLGYASGKILLGTHVEDNDSDGTPDAIEESELENLDSDEVEGYYLSKALSGVPKIDAYLDDKTNARWGTKVMSMDVNGEEATNETIFYVIDTGAPKIYLPGDVYEAILYELADESTPDVVNITMHFPLYPSGNGTTPINLSATHEMFEEYVFVRAPDNYCCYKLGLYFMRYIETMAVTYPDDKHPYLQLIPRPDGEHVIDSIHELPISPSGLAGSTSNVTLHLDGYLEGLFPAFTPSEPEPTEPPTAAATAAAS